MDSTVASRSITTQPGCIVISRSPIQFVIWVMMTGFEAGMPFSSSSGKMLLLNDGIISNFDFDVYQGISDP
jgi:hypothetical protein